MAGDASGSRPVEPSKNVHEEGNATAAGNVYVDTPMPVEEARPVANNSSYFDQLGAQMGIDGLYDKLINARGMRSNNSPQPASTSR